MNSSDSQTSASTVAAKSSSSRLLVLLAVLAIMIGGLAYDRLYAGPGKDAAKDRIEEVVNAKVFAGVDANANIRDKASLLPTDADVRKAVGFAPKWTKKEGDYTLQCFHWWGPIPLNRNYLVVRYRGSNPLLFVDYGDGQTPQDAVETNLVAGDSVKGPPSSPKSVPGMGGGSRPGGESDGGQKSADQTSKSDDKPSENKAVEEKPDAEPKSANEDQTPKTDE